MRGDPSLPSRMACARCVMGVAPGACLYAARVAGDGNDAAMNSSNSRVRPGRYAAGMASLHLDLIHDPQLQFRIDNFNVPASARDEFDKAMLRNLAFIQTLPGFRGHLVFEKVSGPSTFNITTIAAWESPEAIEKATVEVHAYYDRIGFDPRELTARLGIIGEIGVYHAPSYLQTA